MEENVVTSVNVAEMASPKTPDDVMMQEILALLADQNDDEGKTDSDEVDPTPQGAHLDCDPIPFTPIHSRIREPSAIEYAGLKKRTRMKLNTRRFSRRRKDEVSTRMTTEEALRAEVARLEAIDLAVSQPGLDWSSLGATIAADGLLLHRQADVLLEEARSQSAIVATLMQATMTNILQKGQPQQPVTPIRDDQTTIEHTSTAFANVRRISAVIAANNQPSVASGYRQHIVDEWAVSERRGTLSGFFLRGVKRTRGISRAVLGAQFWPATQDPHQRMTVWPRHETQFVVRQYVPPALGIPHPGVVYTQEVHHYPPPFLHRWFTSVNGTQDHGNQTVHFKQSLESSSDCSIHAQELIGVIVTDDIIDGGVQIEVVAMYDTNGVRLLQHALGRQQVAHRLLLHFDQCHLQPATE
ncbi:hypothetical protein Poli38472_003249 [Pythium oligandrum]|uniref:Uncharacterized protein n=1 Tax=Pythium oligandrum TaxID=41045 RepID=A0A8K1C666_PYTOL|nr:hypothetical protein Poli38472_003249 [Pythium oligandrum]|eukprot:TMW57324.1 hypothetical protein Poli38472_003249 [Pythium oligandrum]